MTPRPSGRTLVPLLGVVLAATLAISCSRMRPRFDQTFETPEALAQAVLDGIARNDRARLESLAVTENEFRSLVWPELPAARPERNLPWDYVWDDLRQKSRSSLSSVLAQHGGRRYELLEVHYRGESTRYSTFEAKRDTALRIRTDNGELTTVRLFGATLVTRNGYKILSFVVD